MRVDITAVKHGDFSSPMTVSQATHYVRGVDGSAHRLNRMIDENTEVIVSLYGVPTEPEKKKNSFTLSEAPLSLVGKKVLLSTESMSLEGTFQGVTARSTEPYFSFDGQTFPGPTKYSVEIAPAFGAPIELDGLSESAEITIL